MVNVIMIAGKDSTPVSLPFKNGEDAMRAMETLANTVIGGAGFSIIFEKEPKSRFINPEGGEKDA